MTKFDFTGSNFVGGTWENGFGVLFSYSHDANSYIAKFTFTERHQGPPFIAHGGAIAALLDEAITAAVAQEVGLPAFTVQLDISYRAPVYLNTEVTIVGQVVKVEGRKVFVQAQVILPDGTIATEAKGLFIRINVES
jgi:uncharacterized protein (TIGR00369 family)